MRLAGLRIRNYRTIAAEQSLEFAGRTTLVGPNNSGKTNVLQAIRLLFTGHENDLAYDRATDLTFGAGRAKTSLVASFEGDGHQRDEGIYRLLDELHALLGTERHGSGFTLSLQFSENSNPLYQFFPNAQKPGEPNLRTQYSRIERQLTRDLLSGFSFHYVPSAKSVADLYDDLLIPFLRRIAAGALEPHLDALRVQLRTVSDDLNAELARVGLDSLKASFAFPLNSVEEMFSTFDLNVSDPHETVLFRKGQGIQSTALLASLLWITSEETRQGLTTLWLIEEPESYLHPELTHACVQLLEQLRAESTVVVTTHSLSFVPTDPGQIVGADLGDGRTVLGRFPTYAAATARIRQSLGVRFSDFYNLGLANLLVEGQTDRELIDWARRVLGADHDWPFASRAELLDYGGVKHLAGFLRATFEFIRAERPVVAVFDGDAAGTRERENLQQYFGQRQIPFQPNADFVSVRDRFPIEGLFPDGWIVEIYEAHPAWFQSFSVDALGNLEPFRIADGHKSQVQAELVLRAEGAGNSAWAERWIAFLSACDRGLASQASRLSIDEEAVRIAGPTDEVSKTAPPKNRRRRPSN